MAEVSFLQPHEDDDRDDLVEALESVPYWQSHHNFDVTFNLFDSDPFDLHPSSDHLSLSLAPPHPNPTKGEVSEPDLNTADLFDCENQANFVMDLFHQRVDQSSMRGVGLGSLSPDPVNEIGPNRLELDLGLGFDDGDEGNFGFRVGVVSDSEEDGNEFLGRLLNEEDNDRALDNNSCDDDTSLQLCWDSFQLEDHIDAVEDFEWEEVDGRVDEREVLSMFDMDGDMDEDLNVSVPTVIPLLEEEMGVEMVGTMRNNLEWEVLLNVHNLEAELSLEDGGQLYLGDHDTVEYEMMFGQFAENENAMIGRPPASKNVVENLEWAVLTQEDVENDNSLCAVCKDGMNVGEKAKKLPCSHRYHGDCIVPWLGIRNTCPVCRYELPTDDPDYERRKIQRVQ